MKVVINTSEAGISLSNNDIVRYCKHCNIPYYYYYLVQEKYRNQPAIWSLIDEDKINNLPELIGNKSKYETLRLILSFYEFNTSKPIHASLYDIDRTESKLVEMVEQDLFAATNFKVVYVPDDIEWYIDTYCDECREIIRQKHQIFQ